MPPAAASRRTPKIWPAVVVTPVFLLVTAIVLLTIFLAFKRGSRRKRRSDNDSWGAGTMNSSGSSENFTAGGGDFGGAGATGGWADASADSGGDSGGSDSGGGDGGGGD